MAAPEPSASERYLHEDALVIRRRTGGRWLWLGAAIVLVVVLVWWLTHPGGFAGRGQVDAETPRGQSAFFGILGPSSDSGRTLRINHASARVVHAPDDTETEVLICRGGGIAVSADAHAFCNELVPAKGETLHYGNAQMEQLILRVTSQNPGTVDIDGVDLNFRDGLQFGSVVVGPHITLTVRGR
jgi:hypothetical protein